ncbi:MAG: septation protein A [Gammaproteobacteria bacterium]
MNFLYDIFPVLIFFIVYKFAGIYAATACAMVLSFLQVAHHYWRTKSFYFMHVMTFVLVFVFGGLTLFFHNPLFIKWKVSIINWLFAIAFIVSQHVGQTPLIKRLLGTQLQLPEPVWHKLNRMWATFFAVVGFINLYIIYHFSTNVWVNFKVFGILGLTFIFVLLQTRLLYQSMRNN